MITVGEALSPLKVTPWMTGLEGVIRPIEPLPELVNHSAPSGPAVIPTAG
jgi:hypothetical protein